MRPVTRKTHAAPPTPIGTRGWRAPTRSRRRSTPHALAPAPSGSPASTACVGTLLDLVEIDDGYEAAFEAAAGEALAAVVVDDVDAGRRALELLHRGDVAGAILPLGAVNAPAPLPLGNGEPLRWHVRADDAAVDGLLDALVRHGRRGRRRLDRRRRPRARASRAP